MHLRIPLLAACASFACIGASAETTGETMPSTEQGKQATQSDCVKQAPDEQCDAEAYWTPERMRNAKPLPTPVLDPETMKPVKPE
jgi:hypothetical protein